ncbi:MAG TPA: pre-peptidase C-terminal domain-containing protein, partial [Chthoniobacteraceae bacterium]
MRKALAEGHAALHQLLRRYGSRSDTPALAGRARRHSAPEPLESRIAPAGAFTVTFTNPADGSTIGSSPEAVTVDFSQNVLLPTAQASDLTVDNLAASAFTVVDGDTIRFSLPAPVADGVHTIGIAAGALQDVQGTPLEAFTAQFTLDRTAPRVISTTVQPGDVIAPGELTYVVQFSEPLAIANLNNSDFALVAVGRGETIISSSFGYNDAGDTLTINFDTLPDDRYVLTLLSGDSRFEDVAGNDLDGELDSAPLPPNASGNGTAGGDFAISFTADAESSPFSGTFLPVLPGGSLVQKGTLSTSISMGGDIDTFTFELQAGENITFVAEPGASLRPNITFTAPNGTVLGSNSAEAVGSKATLQTITAPTTGTYTLAVEGAGGTTGLVTVQAVLNAAVESEAGDGGGNETRPTAQSLDGSFISLGGNASRGAVLGLTDLAAGALPTEAEPNNTTAQANVATANFISAPGNLYQLALQGNRSTATETDFFNIGTMQAGDVITISMVGSTGMRGTMGDSLVTLHRGSGAAPVQVAQDDDGGAGGDSLIYRFTVPTNDVYYIEARGFSSNVGTYQVGVYLENAGSAPVTGGGFSQESEPNDTAAGANNASTSWRQVQYLSRTGGTIVTGDVDTYRYFFNAGDLVTVNLDSTSTVDARVSLLNAAGTAIASEDGSSSGPGIDSPIYSFRIPSSGTYFVEARATGGTGSYNADVYLSSTTPPPVPAIRSDFYSLTLQTGETATFGLKANTLGSARFELQNAAGTVLALGSTGGENVDSSIDNFTASTSGTYYIRVAGDYGVEYSLVATKNADFDTSSNSTLGTAQPLGPFKLVLGAIESTADADFYTFEVPEGGSTITITTSAPPESALNPLPSVSASLELYDPAGFAVANADSGAPGSSTRLSHTVSSAGTYTIAVRGDAPGDYLLQIAGANTTNDAPLLEANSPLLLAPINEDATTNSGTLVGDLIGTSIIDPDANALRGIAVISAADLHGQWQFTTNSGGTWTAFGAVGDQNARLLAANPQTAVRFVPVANYHGPGEGLAFRAWDQTIGMNGGLADVTTNGGSTAFSTGLAKGSIQVRSVNDAPAFSLPAQPNLSIPEDMGMQFLTSFATGLSSGDGSDQALSFAVTSNNAALFSVQPAIDRAGTLSYTPAPNAFGIATVTVKLVDDGGTADGGVDTSVPETFTITLEPENDGPTNSVPGAQLIRQGQQIVFSASNGNAISVADPDAGDASVQVSLTASSGALALPSSIGLTFITADAQNLVFSGTLQDINAALQGLSYTPDPSLAGTSTVRLITNDLGNTGGGELTATSIIAVTTSAVLAFTDSATFTDAGGDLVVVRLKGGGSGEIWFAPGRSDVTALVLSGTSAKSTLS